MFAENATPFRSPSTESGCYLWSPPGHSIAIHLSFDVMDELNSLIADASAGLARPGPEIGGLLLGRAEARERLNVWIEDFEAVSCASGDSLWRPSVAEQIALKRRIARHALSGRELQVIGFFRSHTRHGLSLTDDDCALCAGCFSDPANVFLLIKPFTHRSHTGAFFFWEGSGITRSPSYLEFPFDRRSPEAVECKQFALPAASQYATRPMFESIAPAHSPRSKSIGLTASALVIAGLGLWAFSWKPEPGPKRDPAPPSLGLTASEKSELVELRWDHHSPIIAEAQHGTLTIQNGNFQKSVELPQDQLRKGSVVYGRLPAEADIKLEVFTDRKTSVSEVLHLAASGPTPPGPAVVAAMPPAPAARIARVKHHRGRKHPGRSRAKSLQSKERRSPHRRLAEISRNTEQF